MSELFENVKVLKKSNVYFDGKVTSRKVIFQDGSEKTLGVMLPGEYEFGTGAPEVMEVMAGSMEVMLPGSEKWVNYEAGQAYSVPGDSKFKVKVGEVTDYCCSYEK